jgi:hypothetical protein
VSISLVSGRGQLGKQLSAIVDSVSCDEEVYIYHTWNVSDKSEKAQQKEYNKFVKFVDEYYDKKIIFVSTSSLKETYYTFYKHTAESYLLINSLKSLVVRLPTFISHKSVIKEFAVGRVKPQGTMELISVQDAARFVMECANYSGLVRSFTAYGQKISAEYINLILKV